MALFKKKQGGTKVGNTLRTIGSVFTGSTPKKATTTSSVNMSVAPKSTPNYSGATSSIKSSNQTMVPNMTKVPAKATNMTPLPKNGLNMTPLPKNGLNMTPLPKNGLNMSVAPKTSSSKLTSSTKSSGGGSSSSYTPTSTVGSSFSMDTYEEPTASARMVTGDVFAGSDYGDIGKLYSDYMSGGDIVDTSSIRSRAIADVQDRINALNQVYDQQLSRVQQEGVGRTGETTAALAARGLAGSMRGGAIADLTREQNRGLEAQVGAERNNAIQSILSDANKAAIQEIQSKTEARLGGASALISFLKGADERKQNYVNSVAQNLIASGVDLESMTPQQVQQLTQAAQKAGVSFNNIVAAYNMVKASQGAEDGDAQGNLIAQNEEAAGEASAEVLALAKQVNDGVITLQQVPSALRGAVSLAQSSLPNPRINELDAVISTINELATNPRLKAILGPIDQARGSLLLGSKANVAKNLYDQLTGILALEGRSKLKGSGAISDFEFRILKDAQSALGRNLNEEEFKKQLTKVRDALVKRKQKLMQGTTVSGTSSGGASAAMTLEPLTEDERQQLLNEGYSPEEIDSLNPNKVGSGTYSAVNIPSSSRLAYVNNNPGNLRFVGQPGAVRGANGFAKYSSPQAGYEGLLRQIKIDSDRGLTLAQFVNKYAPPTENDTRLYMNQIARSTGVPLNTPINRINIHTLGKAIAQKESGTKIA